MDGIVRYFMVDAFVLQRNEAEDRTGEDTGLGDSHPDAGLLFNNQKAFYENLIVSILYTSQTRNFRFYRYGLFISYQKKRNQSH